MPSPARELYEKNPLPVVDFRFFSGASPGLALPYITGSESLRLTNLTADGNLAFQLPVDRPAITLDIGEGALEVVVVPHTVQIRADDAELDMVWRAAFPYPGPDWLPDMKKSEVTIRG